MGIKDMLLDDETLFRNDEVFNPGYMPDSFVYRDNEVASLTRCIKPALRKGRPVSALITGPPATGKTTAVRLIFDETNKLSKIKAVHINCQIYNTHFKIASEIHKKIIGYIPPETGVPLTRVMDTIFKKLTKEKKSLIVALDDASEMNNINEVLYSLLRAHEVYSNAKTAVWLIATKDQMYKLDGKVRSIFQPERIAFHPYARDEMLDILKARADVGLAPGVLNQQLLRLIAENAEDVRHGLETIKKAALLAESDASRKITEIHVKNALGEGIAEEKTVDSAILDIVKEGHVESGTLYEMLCKKEKISYSKFYRTLQKLKDDQRIEIEQKSGRGRTSIIKKI